MPRMVWCVGEANQGLLQDLSQRSGDGGPACEVESIRRLAGVSPEKMPDETTIPTSAAGWSAYCFR